MSDRLLRAETRATRYSVEIEIWEGDRCVMVADIDNELSIVERREIAEQLARKVNQ